MKVRFLVALVFAMAALGMTAPAQAQLNYDLAANFSITNNPNGAWTYGYCAKTDPLSTGFVAFTETSNLSVLGWPDANCEAWVPVPGWGDPNITHNLTGADYTFAGYHWDANGIGLGPGADASPVVRWTCQEAGTYDVSATFTGNLEGAGTSLWLVGLNGTDPWLNDVTHDWGYGQSQTYTGQLTLSVGETLDFVNISWTNGGQYTGLSATISQVPEPGTLALSAFGLLGVGMYLRRSRS